MKSSQLLWQKLLLNGFVSGEEPSVSQENAPWYVRVMLGIAGWVGALFLLGAVFGGFFWLLAISSPAAAVLGVAACFVSVLIYRLAKKNDFAEQFAFAVSLAGQGVLVFSVLSGLDFFLNSNKFFGQVQLTAMLLVVLQVVLFLLVPNYLHRMWSALIGIGSAVFLLNQFGLYPFTLALVLAAATVVWLQEFRWVKYGEMLRAVGYSLVIVCISHLLTQNYFWEEGRLWQNVFGVEPLGGEMGELLASLALGAVLIALVFTLLNRAAIALTSRVGIAALVLVILVVLIGVHAPGITVGLVIVLLGFSQGNSALTGLGLVTVVVFVSQFYYLLHMTLLEKSVVLFVSGLGLLAVRQVLKYVWPKGAPHA